MEAQAEGPRDEPDTLLVDGRTVAADELAELVYEDLHRIASSFFKSESDHGTMQPTALVHEAYMRLAAPSKNWENRSHFMSLAARIMRGILVDAARAKGREKRGGDRHRITLLDETPDQSAAGVDILELEEALSALAKIKAHYAEVVEMRFFGGMTVEEIAKYRGVSERQIFKDWKMARSYLEVYLADGHAEE